MLRRYYGKISKLPINEFVGHDGELVVDDVTGRVYVMDGVTYGGIELVGATSKLTNSPPSLPLDGSLWYDPNAGRLYIYYGGVWVDACPTLKGDKGDKGDRGDTGTTTGTYNNSNVAAYLASNPQPGTYTNSNVAAYLSSNPQSGTYTNSNVAAYLANNIPAGTYTNSNVAAYLASNPQPGTYTNSNVAAYLSTNPPAGTYTNSNVAAYLVNNIPTGTYTNSNVAAYLASNPQPGTYGNSNVSLLLSQPITLNSVSISSTVNSISTSTGSLTLAGGLGVSSDVHIGGTVKITDATPSTSYDTGALIVDGGLGINGNINLSGNINITNGNINIVEFTGATGNFYGDIVTGFGAMYAGKSGFTPLPYTVAQISTNSNSYSQINMQNIDSGKLSSADFVGTADIGSDSSWFFDLGVASSGYDPIVAAQNNALGTSIDPLDTYLYVQGNVSVPNSGGNLTIGTSQTNKVVKFIAGGVNAENVVLTLAQDKITATQPIVSTNFLFANTSSLVDVINSAWQANAATQATQIAAKTSYSNSNVASYLVANPQGSTYSNSNVASYLPTYSGNVNAAYFTGNGSSLTGLTYSSASNIIGPGSNVSLIAGSYSYLFDNTGTFTMPANSDIIMTGINSILSVSGTTLLGGYSQIGGYYSTMGLKYPGGNTQYGITLQPTADNTNAITFLNASGNNIGSITQTSSTVKFAGDGSQLTGVSIPVTGSWTLSAGANTVSLTVPINGTYSIWVRGNIPNGIVTYTATVVVTNTNVPVVGTSYGWYYAAGNALVLTSIPTQVVGTANNISSAVVSTTTANVFTFGITNNSGSSQAVIWGYTKL